MTLIALQAQYIITFLISDLGGNLCLTAHRINGDDTALEFHQQRQQLGDRCNLVGFLIRGLLPQDHPVGAEPGAHHV